MSDRDNVVEALIRWHFEVEPELLRVYRVLSSHEDDPAEPIKLVEVNRGTIATGRFEAFGFAPTKDVPFPTLIAEVTPEELAELVLRGDLPKGWNLEHAREYLRPAA